MVVIKNVAVVGASGALGKPLVQALLDSGKFNVTAVARESSTATFPSSVKVTKANYESVESLKAAFQGQDAVVSAVGSAGLQGQTLLIDAALAAGVKRFLPSEFGSDTDNPKSRPLPVFGYKVATQTYVEEKAANNPDFTYTLVRNGPFLDYGVQVGFLINPEKTRVFDGGDQLFSATSLYSVGLAVVGVLTHLEETKNRAVYIEDIRTSQNKLLAIAKKVVPGKPWEVEPVSLVDLRKSADERLAKGDLSALYDYLAIAIYGEGQGGLYTKLDNELLGVPGKTDADIEGYLKVV